jgi:hypothetical protein
MCGIVAAIAAGNIVPVLIEGLNKLEYRGYDSAGLALLNPTLTRLRSVGRVAELAAQAEGLVAQQGIAHTRWATHGVPSERNAHPHVSAGLAVVHNGIIENYAEIKQQLVAAGIRVRFGYRYRSHRAPDRARVRDGSRSVRRGARGDRATGGGLCDCGAARGRRPHHRCAPRRAAADRGGNGRALCGVRCLGPAAGDAQHGLSGGGRCRGTEAGFGAGGECGGPGRGRGPGDRPVVESTLSADAMSSWATIATTCRRRSSSSRARWRTRWR